MQLTIPVPDDVGRRLRQLPDRDQFVVEALSRALRERPAVEQRPGLRPSPPPESAPRRVDDSSTREGSSEPFAEPDRSRPLQSSAPARPGIRFVSREERKRWMAEIRSTFNLQGEPMAAEELQEMSRKFNLGETELSSALIQAREE